jgi:hypothetical protein
LHSADLQLSPKQELHSGVFKKKTLGECWQLKH